MTGRRVVRVPGANGTWWPRLVHGPVPPRPGPQWRLVRVTTAGICGSDLRGLAQAPVHGAADPAGVVPGHEVVGVLADGPGSGERVVVHPLVTCAARDEPLCASCRNGRFGQCDSFWQPTVRWSKSLGFSTDLGGGWADWVWAHRDMVRTLPPDLPDRTAVLAEPLSVAISGVRSVRDHAGDDVVIVGGGTLGLLTVVAVASVLPGSRCFAVVRHDFQADAARALGAEPVRTPADLPGARPRGAEVLIDGPGLAVDAGGTSSSLIAAMRAVRAGGRVLTLGNPDDCTDLSPLWLKGLTLLGHLEHAAEPSPRPPESADSLDEAVRLLGAAPDLGRLLVTHTFATDDVARALAVARARRTHRAIKVILQPPS
ncbi:alcohol dehydrogenase catalytic domain-containing protein [Streptomyces sp. MP131-18]|uniref:zinc-dependent alcohol dehydrogenase n=1 Tax=Streptomyces sp. MP131-18 TaxID=1857892 RepID=UPI0009D2C785|nr:alcohol dehydrogenase catalytic domain-containing protein [Streptomyces sp. MP131-18]ONK10485.1 2-deoxy-scyllo-inosamine dehydrogenase [Streptomyces sp. MP131-18]